MADDKSLDAIEKALNDAASKTGTLWISFITLVVYFVIAVGSVTHRMLFLQEPIKLPVLNVDLPLVGFFVAAPILLVTYHFYLLLQLAVLGNKAEIYDVSLCKEIALQTEREARRQRLDQFPFVQLMVGDGRPQSRSVRAATKIIGIVTIVIAPLLALLMIQIVFLPYHDSTVTWLHRFAIVVDLILLRVFWSKADFAASSRLHKRSEGLQPQHIPIVAAALFTVAFSIFVATFPGETPDFYRPFRGAREITEAMFNGEIDKVSGQRRSWLSNTLILSEQDLIDRERAAKMESKLAAEPQNSTGNDALRTFRSRDLRGAVMNGVDLRFVDFTAANLRDASFVRASLTGARFDCVFIAPKDVRPDKPRSHVDRDYMNDSSCTSLVGAKFDRANAQNASFIGARLFETIFDDSSLQGADFSHALIVAASFQRSKLQGATFADSKIFAARFNVAQMHATSFSHSTILASAFFGGLLFGADLESATLNSVNLLLAQMQGTNLKDADIDLVSLRGANLWRAQIDDAKFKNLVGVTKVAALDNPKASVFLGASHQSVNLAEAAGLRVIRAEATDGILAQNTKAHIEERLKHLSADTGAVKDRQASLQEQIGNSAIEGEQYRQLVSSRAQDLVCRPLSFFKRDEDEDDEDDTERSDRRHPDLDEDHRRAATALRGIVRSGRLLAMDEYAESFRSDIINPSKCPLLPASSVSDQESIDSTIKGLTQRRQKQKQVTSDP